MSLAKIDEKIRGIYVHIPFCIRKCRYCDFVSYCKSEDEQDNYVDALIREMSKYRGVKADTVFIGGGTPTALSAANIRRVCGAITEVFELQDGCEFTVEANPGTLTEEKLAALLDSGVNRLSIGVQSFNDTELAQLGRIHSAEEAYNTVLRAHRSGFENLSVDLMTGIPMQTAHSLKENLKTALELPIKHISAYSLIIEEGTPMLDAYERGELVLPDEDEERAMYEMCVKYLGEHGFGRYEISNYAKKGYECKHNIKYWECREYYGFGTAAHSYVNGQRYSNTNKLDEYLSGTEKRYNEESLSKADMISEFIIMGMRMSKGINKAEFKSRFGKEIEELYGNELKKFISGGFILTDGENYYLSDEGVNVSNLVLCEFV